MTHWQDDRTEEQRKTHRYAVVGTDRFLSGWGGATGGTSVSAWAFDDATSERRLIEWVESKKMKRVRVVALNGYRPKCAHLHIYVVAGQDHPSGAVGVGSKVGA